MIEPGKYRAKAVDWGFGHTNGGKPQIAVLFDLLDLAGQQINWYGYFTEKTTERTLESLRHCGWSCDRIDVLTGMGDAEVQVVVEHETDEQTGQTRARVKWVNAAGSAGVGLKAQMDPGQLAAFAASMRGAAIASKQKHAPAKAAPRQAHDAGMPDDSDIPPF